MWTPIMAAQGDPFKGQRFSFQSPDAVFKKHCSSASGAHQVSIVSSSPTSPGTVEEELKLAVVHVEESIQPIGDGECHVTVRKTTSQEIVAFPAMMSPELQSVTSRVRSRLRRFGSSFRDSVRKVAWRSPLRDRFHERNSPAANKPPAIDNEHRIGCCNCKLAVDPTKPFHYRWLFLVTVAVLYNLVFVIGRAVFWELNNAVPVLWWTLDGICDAIYVADTVIHIHEGYLEQGIMETDARKLRRHYFLSKKWRMDALSLLPTDLIYLWWSPYQNRIQVPCPVIVRLNRCLRCPRMSEFFDKTETRTGYPNAFRICKVVLAILVLIHWNACSYFAISYAIGFGTDQWVYNLSGARNSSLSRQYIYSFYWSTLTLTTIGETPQPERDVEYIFVVLDFLAGVLIFATIVGNIGSMISNMNTARVEFQTKMDGVKQYMAFRRVSSDLESRVIRWFSYTWANKQALDEDRVLAALPDKLKAEIAIHVHLDTLKKVQIFQDCEPGLLEELVLKLRLQVFSPGDYICRKGDVGKEMYIVKRGRLIVVGDDGESVLATLGAGSVFGEVSVLDIPGNRTGNRRTANVRSLGYSDLFCLAKQDLWEALADYPEAKQSLIERGCQLLRKDGLLDENAFKKAQTACESLSEKVDRLDSHVKNLETLLSLLRSEYGNTQSKLLQRISDLEKVHSPRKNRKKSNESIVRTENDSSESPIGESSSVSLRRSFQGVSKLKRHKQHTL